jgi:hypothetical protein
MPRCSNQFLKCIILQLGASLANLVQGKLRREPPPMEPPQGNLLRWGPLVTHRLWVGLLRGKLRREPPPREPSRGNLRQGHPRKGPTSKGALTREPHPREPLAREPPPRELWQGKLCKGTFAREHPPGECWRGNLRHKPPLENCCRSCRAPLGTHWWKPFVGVLLP